MKSSGQTSYAALATKWFCLICRQGSARGALVALVIARDRTVVRCLPVRQVEQHFVDIAPAPSLRRIVALDDRMPGGMKMLGRVLVGRIVAATDVTATAADAQM